MIGAETPTLYLLLSIALLICLSAYFSGTETAMMALNRYRLRHMVKRGHRGARKANRMLKRQDRLLGVILVGNNWLISVPPPLRRSSAITYWATLVCCSHPGC